MPKPNNALTLWYIIRMVLIVTDIRLPVLVRDGGIHMGN